MLCKLKNILPVFFLILWNQNIILNLLQCKFTFKVGMFQKSKEKACSLYSCPMIGHDAQEADIRVTDTLDSWE